MQGSTFPAWCFLLYHTSDRGRKILRIFKQREIMCSERTELLVFKYWNYLPHLSYSFLFYFCYFVTSSHMASLFYCSDQTVGDEWTFRASSEPLWPWVTINRARSFYSRIPACRDFLIPEQFSKNLWMFRQAFICLHCLFLFFVFLLHAFLLLA